MKVKYIIILLIMIYLHTPPLNAQDMNQKAHIETTGYHEIKLSPDELYLSIRIDEKDNKGGASIEKQEQEIKTYLQQLGVPLTQFKVTQAKNYLDKSFWKNQVLASKHYSLKVNSAAQLYQVLAKLQQLKIGQAQLNGVSHSKIKDLKEQASMQAAKNARQKAEKIANALGQSLGEALYVADRDYQSGPIRPVLYSRALAAKAPSSESVDEEPPLEINDIVINGEVFVRFEIKKK